MPHVFTKLSCLSGKNSGMGLWGHLLGIHIKGGSNEGVLQKQGVKDIRLSLDRTLIFLLSDLQWYGG